MSDQDNNDTMTVQSDSLLLEQLERGDEASFETLFYRHYDKVYGLLFRLLGNRVEAEDIAQEVFLKLYRQPLSQGKEHYLGSWLYRVATNMAYNQIRSRKRLWRRNLWLLPERNDLKDDPSEELVQEETRSKVRQILIELPQRQTQLLVLREMGFSYSELAEACDIAPGSVGTLLARAAKAFREAFKNESSD